MARKQSDDSFSEEEAARRLAAALRGARLTGHKAMKDIPKKNGESRAILASPKLPTQKSKRQK